MARARERGGPWVALAAVVFYPLTWLLARRRMEGLEWIPAHGPALVVGNHVSYLDPVYTAVFVHRAGRIPRFLAKASLWDVPVFGRVLSGSRQIPVSRGSVEAGASLAAARAAFDDDGVVVIYPEGTITRDPAGWPMTGRSGAARLALDRDLPVVPLVHWGTLAVYDHYGKRFRPSRRTTITVRAGQPVPLDDLRARVRENGPDVALLRETTERMMSAVRDLLADVRGEAPPGTRSAAEPDPSTGTRSAAEPDPPTGTRSAAEPDPSTGTRSAAEPDPSTGTRSAAEPDRGNGSGR